MNKSVLKSLWWIIKLQASVAKGAFVWNIFYNLYTGLIGIVNTFVAAKLLTSVTEVAFGSGEERAVYIWLVILLVIEVVGSVLQSINQAISRRADQLLELAGTELYFTKLYQLSQEQFEDEDFKTTAERALDGLNKLWQASYELSSGMSALISFAAAMIAILAIAPLVGLLIILVAIPNAILQAKQSKRMDKIYKKAEPTGRVSWRTRWYLLDPEQMPEIRLINGFKQLVATWKKSTSKYNDMLYKVERRNARVDAVLNSLGPFANFIANIYFFRLLVAGTIGLDRFIFLRGILDQAAGAALRMALAFDRLYQVGIDLGNFNAFYQTEPAIPNGSIKVDRPLTIEFKDVSFKYPGTDNPALQNVSFMIAPGSKLALVGENGAGKSTLIKLLLRQYLPTSGQILVNGHDIRDVEQDSYYAALSILSQNFLLLSHLTIEENLVMGNHQEGSKKSLQDALGMVGADKFIDKLPHKLQQRLDSSFKDGSNLSGGQLQRLGVARAILRGGDVMILDEPTSAIDAKAEYNIFNNIYAAHADRTTLIVSHRFSTVRKAEKVIVMDNGKIIEYGSHEELMEFGGLYKEMFDLQAEGYR